MSVIYPAIRSAVYPAVRGVLDISEKKKTPEQIIQNLFAQGQQGFWLPFTDFASLTQDSAGTLPYTALEQPVGRVLDRSGRGNHATQVTSTARGKVSARVNLLQKSNQIGDGFYWGKVNGLSATLGAAQGPDGSYSMSRLVKTAGTPNQRAQQTFPTAPNTLHTIKLVIQKDSGHGGRLSVFNSGVSVGIASADIAWAGDAPAFGSPIGWISSPVATAIGGGKFLVTATFSPGVHTACAVLIYVGDTTDASLLVGDAEIKLASQAALPYQRVTTATDYDDVGFPKYLRLDGTDDFYTCGGGGSTTGFFYSDVIRPTGTGSRTLFYNGVFGTKSGFSMAITSANKLAMYVGDGATNQVLTSTDSVLLNALSSVQAWMDATTCYVQINDDPITTMAKPAMPAGPSTIWLGNTGSFEHFNGTMTEPIYRAGPPPSAYERSVIRNYQRQKAGML